MGSSDRFRWVGHRLLVREAQDYESPTRLAEAGAKVLAQLEQGLVTLIGQRGARLLMLRALRAARTQYAFLGQAEGSLEAGDTWDWLASGASGVEPAAVYEGLATVVAEALALLSDFIGVTIVLRQVRRIWPALPCHGDPLEEVGHERV